jgi:Fe-S oxidoreductase
MSLKDVEQMLYNCTRCSNCRWTPAIRSERFASICPSITYGKFHPYSGGGKLISAAALLEGKAQYDDAYVEYLYACSMCGGCDTGCKMHFGETVEPLTSLYAIREQAWADGKTPEPLRAVVRNLQNSGNRFGLPAAIRSRWYEPMPLPRVESAEVLLHIGDPAFDEAAWPALRYVLEQFLAAGVPFVVGGLDEPDCGALPFEIGAREVALALANRTADWVRRVGARQLVTCSDQAYAAFRSLYPRLGVSLGDLEILHVSQWLAGRAGVSGQHRSGAEESAGECVTYHDACHLGRLGERHQPWNGQWKTVFNAIPVRADDTLTGFGVHGVYEEPRQLLDRAGARLVEMERNREFAFCAGAGAGAEQAYPAFARVAGLHRLEEAIASGASVLVSGCSSCTVHMQHLARSEALPIRVVGLLEYLRSRGPACGGPGNATSNNNRGKGT